MLELKYIREHPAEVKEALIKRNEMAPIDEILELDERRRTLLVDVQGLRHQRNVTSKEISRMKEKDQVLIEEMRRLGDEIKALDREVKSIEEELNRLLLQLPNLFLERVHLYSQRFVARSEGCLFLGDVRQVLSRCLSTRR